jgi:hypothetical protein
VDWARSPGIRSSIAKVKVVAVGALIAIPALNTAIPAHGAPAPLDNPTDPDCAPDPANPLNPPCLRPNRNDSPSFDPPSTRHHRLATETATTTTTAAAVTAAAAVSDQPL